MTVNIKGIPKEVLLKALWSNMKPAAFFTMSGIPSPAFDNKEASSAVKQYIDYFSGRCIKTDLSVDMAEPHSYDRDAGPNAFARIVSELRQQYPLN